MNIINKKLSEIIPYSKNTKKHDKTQIDNVAESIKQYGFVQPIVIDKNGVIVIGHCRALAAKKLKLKEVPCVCVDELTEEQIKALRIVDNKSNESDWDMDFLADELSEIDLTMFDFDFGIENEGIKDEEESKMPEKEKHESLVEKFGVPPFSILDARQGYWQDRKRMWKGIGLESENGRDVDSLKSGFNNKYNRETQSAVSIFDPVLCEIMYKWFCPENGKIYDCFAGGSVRGIVATKLGYDYTGIDLRPEQIDANIANAKEIGVLPKWFCDDSLNADKYVVDNSCDMIFSCPPYADLEVYSDDPRDISNMDYEDFCKAYAQIIEIACRKLKENRFAVFVVGDVRDKNGFYRNFVDYTKKCFNDCGLATYNEAILIDPLGTAMLRASQYFKSRKLVKVHQNILCFYKGDVQKIKDNFGEVFINDVEKEVGD